MQKAIEVARLCVAAALTVAVLTVVVGLAVHVIGWLGDETGLWQAVYSVFSWIGNAPGSDYVNGFVERTGISTAWLGYSLAMAVLAIFGFFRGRK
ncbi:hypothetical protein [Comamonas aquatica]|uniref:hypothetical protein n=1 Tax=Comamonas aquatica TaxID=225991 RepID=UPI0024474663|nr:hypothetical protein [Comamonas aquatica]MDH1815707.1 hypothetical protein [Comamonas aquatica]